MTISHAPPDLPAAPEKDPAPGGLTSPGLEPIVPASVRRARLRSVPRWLRRTVGPLLLLALW
nr:hypothetical protein [Streptomyces microflavus]